MSRPLEAELAACWAEPASHGVHRAMWQAECRVSHGWKGYVCLELVRVAGDQDVGVEPPLHHRQAVLVAPGHHLAPAYEVKLFLTAVCRVVLCHMDACMLQGAW